MVPTSKWTLTWHYRWVRKRGGGRREKTKRLYCVLGPGGGRFATGRRATERFFVRVTKRRYGDRPKCNATQSVNKRYTLPISVSAGDGPLVEVNPSGEGRAGGGDIWEKSSGGHVAGPNNGRSVPAVPSVATVVQWAERVRRTTRSGKCRPPHRDSRPSLFRWTPFADFPGRTRRISYQRRSGNVASGVSPTTVAKWLTILR